MFRAAHRARHAPRILAVAAAASTQLPAHTRCSEEPSTFPAAALLAAGGVAVAGVAGAAWWHSGSDQQLDDWSQRWARYSAAGVQPGFHKPEVNPRLVEHLNTFLGERKASAPPSCPSDGCGSSPAQSWCLWPARWVCLSFTCTYSAAELRYGVPRQ